MSRRRRASVSKAPEPAPNSWRTRERWGCGRQLGNLAGWAEWVGRGGAWVSVGACAYAGAWLAWVWGLLAVLGRRDPVWRRSAVVSGCDVFVRCPGGAGNHPVFPLRHTPILIPHTHSCYRSWAPAGLPSWTHIIPLPVMCAVVLHLSRKGRV